MPRPFPTPLRIVHLSLVGSMLTFLALGLVYLPYPQLLDHHGMLALLWSARWALLVPAIPFGCGVTLMIRNQSRLTTGVIRGVWTEEQLEAARLWVNQAWLNRLLVGLSLLVIVLSAVPSSVHPRGFIGIYAFALILNPLTHLRATLSKPARRVGLIDFGSFKPIQSDHWGQPPTSV
jgi:hypothetical protein